MKTLAQKIAEESLKISAIRDKKTEKKDRRIIEDAVKSVIAPK